MAVTVSPSSLPAQGPWGGLHLLNVVTGTLDAVSMGGQLAPLNVGPLPGDLLAEARNGAMMLLGHACVAADGKLI